MSKACPECGDSVQGRVDKKFCSDMCRNSHNNRIKGDRSPYYRNVNIALRRNYRILEELIPEGTIMASRAKLLQKGFNFGYYTNVHTRKGVSYYFCYEYGYHPADNDHFFLVRKEQDN